MAQLGGVLTAVLWGYYAVEPTIGSAAIAAVASIANTALLMWHARHMNTRLDERRNVIVRGTPDDPESVLVTSEDRRELRDPAAQPSESRKTRKLRRRPRRDRRK